MRAGHGRGVLALCGVLLLTSCTSGSERAALPEGEKEVRPVAVGDRPQWTHADLGLERVRTVALDSGAAVVVGSAVGGGLRLVVADAHTGEVRRVLDAAGQLDPTADGVAAVVGYDGRPVLAGSGADRAVLVSYQNVEEGDRRFGRGGVAAVSLKDGGIGWKRDLGTAGERSAPVLLSADADRALVGVSATAGGAVTTHALAADTGGSQWQHTGEWVYALAGDRAFGARDVPADWQPHRLRNGSVRSADDEPEGASVFALDAATGEEKWGLDDRYEEAVLHGALGRHAVLRVRGGPGGAAAADPRAAVFDTATGRERHQLGAARLDCASDQRTLLVCSDRARPSVVTLRAAEGAEPVRMARTALDEESDRQLEIGAVRAGRIHLSTVSSGAERELRTLVVDRAGNTLQDGLPGRTLAVSDRHGAFAVASGPGALSGLAVHRLATGDTPPSSGPGRAAESPVVRLKSAAQPTWTGRVGVEDQVGDGVVRLGLERLDGAEFAGEVLILHGETAGEASGEASGGSSAGASAGASGRAAFVAVDPADGAVRWRIDAAGGLPAGARPAGPDRHRLAAERGLLLLEYVAADGARGIAAVAVRDGTVRWQVKLDDGDPDGLVRWRLEGVDDTGFAVVRRTFSGGGAARSGGGELIGSVETRVHSLKDGRRLRTVAGFAAAGLHDGRLLGSRYRLPLDPQRWEPTGAVASVDAATGKERWSTKGRYPQASLRGAGARAGVVHHPGGTAVLDPDTGRPLAESHDLLTDCSGSGQPAMICWVGKSPSRGAGYPVAVRVSGQGAGAKATVLPLLRLSGQSDLVVRGEFIALEARSPRASEDTYTVTDLHGRPVLGTPPGWARAIDDRWVVYVRRATTPEDPSGAEVLVHRRG